MSPDPRRELLARRSSGVLLHLSSLPGPNGCGDLGAAALHMVDWLASAAQSIWQVLPLTPTGAGHSPYQSPSAFAGNPALVDLDSLQRSGWLALDDRPAFDAAHCDFDRALPWRAAMLRRAWQGFCMHARPEHRAALDAFVERERAWLDDYALFMLLDGRYGAPWTAWPAPLARRDPRALAELRERAADELGHWHFVQWCFDQQWRRLREHAQARGVALAGDLPIFVAHHSADVWAHPQLFDLDDTGAPRVVAGVPPDYFSATGQRWGNPLYRWSLMAHDGYAWWKQRLARLLGQVDLVRIDHFRGFESYWEIPAHLPTAEGGRWVRGPGRDFFLAMQDAFGALPVIAEDLGVDMDAAIALRKACGFPGMRVLQFGFDGHAQNPHLPHNYEAATVAYTGTHDNDTTVGWWNALAPQSQTLVRRYLGPAVDEGIHWAMIRAVSQSVARTVIVPFQDVLGLDGRHRMNTPGQAEGCWRWRFDWDQVGPEPAARLAEIARAHGRA